MILLMCYNAFCEVFKMKKKEIKYKIKTECDLVKYLNSLGYAKNKIKTYVRLGYILVNDRKIKKLPFLLKEGETLMIDKDNSISYHLHVVYEDDNYLVVDKEAGLLTISTSREAKEKEDTLYKRVRKYLNEKGEYAFVVNRIDKETSGLVIFVKNVALKEKLQSNWNSIVKKRGYIAIVKGVIYKSGHIDNYLYEDKRTYTHSTKVGGKRAITDYKVIRTSGCYTMLDVDIKTGRKNQIRVHFAEMGYPILGDKKYFSHDNPLKRLALHHYMISLIDPLSGELLTFSSRVPEEFYDLFS